MLTGRKQWDRLGAMEQAQETRRKSFEELLREMSDEKLRRLAATLSLTASGRRKARLELERRGH